MRQFKILEQDEGEKIVTEDWIRENYFPYWKEMMIKMGIGDQFNFEFCLEDWIAVNWAEEIK